MLENENENVNIEHKREELNDAPMKSIPLWKRIYLLAMGIGGLNIIAIIISVALMFLPENQANSLTNIITYSVLFCAMFGIIIFDLPKFVYQFKDYRRYLYGLLFGLAVIGFDVCYSNIINLFYTFHVSENEETIRGVITLYPALSIIVIGILGPICEELAYRVGLFGLIKKWSVVGAFFASTILFGLAHFTFSGNILDELVNLPIYLFSGFIFTFAYYKYGFIGSMSAHILNNLISVIVTVAEAYKATSFI